MLWLKIRFQLLTLNRKDFVISLVKLYFSFQNTKIMEAIQKVYINITSIWNKTLFLENNCWDF